MQVTRHEACLLDLVKVPQVQYWVAQLYSAEGIYLCTQSPQGTLSELEASLKLQHQIKLMNNLKSTSKK